MSHPVPPSNSSMSAPTSTATGAPAVTLVLDSLASATAAMESNNLQIVVKGVNFVLQKSFESNSDTNVSAMIQLEQHPHLLHAMCDLLDIINPAAAFVETACASTVSYHQLLENEYNGHAWDMSLLCDDEMEFKFLTRYLDDNMLLLSLLSCLRNFSFELINEAALATNMTILKHLLTVLLALAIHGIPMEAGQLALETLLNIANRVDVSGRRRAANNFNCFEDHTSASGAAANVASNSSTKDAQRLSMSKHMNAAYTIVYMQIARKLFTTSCIMLREDHFINRYYTAKALELLSKLLTSNEKENFVRVADAPEAVSLLSLHLAVGSTRAEPLIVPDALVSLGDPLGRSRPPFAALLPTAQQPPHCTSSSGLSEGLQTSVGWKLMPATYLTSDCIDFELRDLALESLLVLCRASAINADHLLEQARVVDLLQRLARMPSSMGVVGVQSTISAAYRTDGNNKAAHLLATLLGPREVEDYVDNLRRLRTKLLFQVTCDDNMADVISNKVNGSFLTDTKQTYDTVMDTASMGDYSSSMLM